MTEPHGVQRCLDKTLHLRPSGIQRPSCLHIHSAADHVRDIVLVLQLYPASQSEHRDDFVPKNLEIPRN